MSSLDPRLPKSVLRGKKSPCLNALIPVVPLPGNTGLDFVLAPKPSTDPRPSVKLIFVAEGLGCSFNLLKPASRTSTSFAGGGDALLKGTVCVTLPHPCSQSWVGPAQRKIQLNARSSSPGRVQPQPSPASPRSALSCLLSLAQAVVQADINNSH